MADLTDKQKKLAELIRDDLQSVEGKRSEIISKADKLDRLWRGQRTRKSYLGRSNISIPFHYWYTEQMVPRFMSSLFGGRDIMEVVPLPGSSFDAAKANKHVMNYQLMFEMSAFQYFLGFCQTMERWSSASMKIKWNAEEGHPEFHLLRPGELLWDPKPGPIIKRARWKAHYTEKDRGELEEGINSSGYIQASVEKLIASQAQQMTSTPGIGGSNNDITYPKQRAFFPLWEWWGQIPVDWAPEVFPDFAELQASGWRPQGKFVPVIALWGKDQLVRAMPDPYPTCPFLTASDVNDPFGMFGFSEGEFNEGLQNAVSDILNQRIDNVTMNINKLWKVLKGSGIRREQLISVPHGYIEVGSMKDLEAIEVQNVTQDAYREVDQILGLLKSGVGMEDISRGVDKPSVDTAAGMQLLMSQANLRPGLKVQLFHYVVVMGIGEIMLAQNTRFLPGQKMGFILGESDVNKAMQNYTAVDRNGTFKVMPMGYAIAGSKDVRVGQLTNFLNVLNSMGPNAPPVSPEVIEEICALVDIRKAMPIIEAWTKKREEQLRLSGALDPAGTTMTGQGNGLSAEGMDPQDPKAVLLRMLTGLPSGQKGMPGMANMPGAMPPVTGINGAPRG